MPENNAELKQEEVFRYIDQQLKNSRNTSADDLRQNTRPSFRMVMLVNAIALAIAASGYLIVDKIFREQAYQLVGTDKSIKGLEDVLLAELQKKASADLISKQKELEDIKKKLTDLNNQMEGFRTQQENKLRQEIQAKEQELKARMEAELKNKTGAEKQQIEQQYAQQMQNITQNLREQALQQEEAYRKELETQKKALVESQNQNQQALSQAQNELKNTQDEYRKMLEEEKSKSQDALRQVSMKLEERQKTDDFYVQVNTLFQTAIGHYQAGRLEQARQVLTGVRRLYQNIPPGVVVSSVKQDVDLFFADAVTEYITLKEEPSGNMSGYQEYLISMKNMQDFSADLKKGLYQSRSDQAEKKLVELQKQLPQVFDFYSSYSGYQVLLDDISAQSDLNRADKAYADKDFQSASQIYLNILQKQPRISSRLEVLNRLSTSLLAGGNQINPEKILLDDKSAQDQKAAVVYRQGLQSFQNRKWSDAQARFETVITEYPGSSYTRDALKRLVQASLQMNADTTVTLKEVQVQQEKSSAELFREAELLQAKGEKEDAVKAYSRLISEYPLSSRVEDSLERIQTLSRMEESQVSSPVNEIQVSQAIREAERLLSQAQYQAALDKTRQIMLENPATTNMERVLDLLSGVYQELQQSSNQELQQIRQSQEQAAASRLQQADKLIREKDFAGARQIYSEVLLRYPLSSQVESALKGLDESYSLAMSQSRELSTRDQQEAKKILDQARKFQAEGNAESALSNYSYIMQKYPQSVFSGQAVQDILTLADKPEIDQSQLLQDIKKQQDKEAGAVYLQADKARTQGNTDEAIRLYSLIINQYGLSSYIEESLQGLQTSLTSQAQKLVQSKDPQQPGNTAIFLTRNVGRVVDIVDNELILDTFSGFSLETGDELYIMRKQGEKTLYYVAEAKITRFSPVMSRASITRSSEAVNLGDLVFMK